MYYMKLLLSDQFFSFQLTFYSYFIGRIFMENIQFLIFIIFSIQKLVTGKLKMDRKQLIYMNEDLFSLFYD